jgi:hypothetical protein
MRWRSRKRWKRRNKARSSRAAERKREDGGMRTWVLPLLVSPSLSLQRAFLTPIGGGLVIGLSAGLLAPVIGAGLGAAFATVGISGTTGFLAGAGGAAMITTTGVLTGANIAGRGMAKRTREVRTFEFRPIHNLKRVTCYMCIPGYVFHSTKRQKLIR